MAKKVLVIGATGTQGGAVARKLLKEDYDVLAASREENRLTELVELGAEPVTLDLRDPHSVEYAASKADWAFFHAPMGIGGPEEEDVEEKALKAILKADVKHVSYSTGFALPPEPVGVPQMDNRVQLVNKVLKAGRTTVFVPTGYLENFSAPWSVPYIRNGELLYPLSPGVRIAWVTNDDVGACTAAAFLTPKSKGKRLRVAGPESLTLPEVAKQIGDAIGRTVSYRQVNGQEYADLLAPYMDEETAEIIGAGYERIANEQNPLMTPDTSQTQELLGVTFTSVYEWAKSRNEFSF